MNQSLKQSLPEESVIKSQSFAATIVKVISENRNTFAVESKTYFQHQINKFKEGTKVTLEIHTRKPKRTEQQNKYWWVYITLIGGETGHTPEEIHEWAKRMFLPPRYVKIMKTEMKLPASTPLLSKSEMSDYLDRISAATNVPLPDPSTLKNYISNNDPINTISPFKRH